jgi:tetratricopeptide (TPR) repeat protein
MSGCTEKQQDLTVDELISLGEKYLLDLNYEQALIQFNKVIEIEPMNVRGYTGAAEAYIGLEQLDEAIAILQRGLEIIDNNVIHDMLDLLGKNNNKDLQDELTSEQNQLIQQLTRALIEEDYDSAATIVRSDIYIQIVEEVGENGSIIHNDLISNLIIYPMGYVYCGELDNDLRSGKGTWFTIISESHKYYYYKGQWVNDLPNGEGKICILFDENYIEKQGARSYALYTEEVGTFIDGYYDGIFTITWNMNSGEVHYWTPTYSSGIAMEYQDAITDDEGYYSIAICEYCDSNLVSKETELHSVLGFEKY